MKPHGIPLWLCVALTPWIGAGSALAAPAADSKHPDAITQEDYAWWRKARFGIFIHWNTSSLLARGGGSWQRAGRAKKGEASTNKTDFDAPFELTDEIIRKYRGDDRPSVPQEIYDNMFKVFNPTDFDAMAWAKTFKDAGAGYIVFTSKHHDGFCMFDSKVTRYDIMSTPFKRDIAQELADACAKAGLKVIWYYSVVDWYDPRFDPKNPKPYEDYLVAQIDELFSKNKNVSGVWWDGGGIEIDNQRVWRTIKKHCEHPIANGRGIKLPGVRFGTPEQKLGSFNMGNPWESCVTMQGEGWFWNGGKNIKPLNSCLRLLVDAAGGDGNLLLDFGPTEKGTIYKPIRKNYLGMGKWLEQYGESIRGTRGGPYTPGHWGVSTRKGHTVYLHITQQWPSGVLELPPLPAKITGSKVLTGGSAKVTQSDKGLRIEIDAKHHARPDTIVALTLDKPALDLPVIKCPLGTTLTRDAKVSASSQVRGSGRGAAGGVVEYVCEFDENGKHINPKKHPYPKELLGKMPWLRTPRGHIWRYWMAKPDDQEPWIQLDLGKPETFRRISLFEKFNRIEDYEIQIKSGGDWKTVARGGELSLVSIELPKPVTAQVIRLVVHKYHSDLPNEGSGIREFDLFPR